MEQRKYFQKFFRFLAACNLSTESVNIKNKMIIEEHDFKGKKLPFMELL